MKLADLLSSLKETPHSVYGSVGTLSILSLTDDSRSVDSNSLFVLNDLSRPYLSQVLLAKPACIFLSESHFLEDDIKSRLEPYRTSDSSSLPVVVVCKDQHAAYGKVASSFYGDPSSKMEITGVTGTNGKTSVTSMLYFLWRKSGYRSGIIGTLGVKWWDGKNETCMETGYTTPRPAALQSILAKMVDAGVSHVAMEVSSEALLLGRVEGCRFSQAIFTNLTPDHLNVHNTMENYFESKKHLFDLLCGEAKSYALIYTGDPYGKELARYIQNKNQQSLTLTAIGKPLDVPLKVPLNFNKINATLAVKACSQEREMQSRAFEWMQEMDPVPGRFNPVFADVGSEDRYAEFQKRAALAERVPFTCGYPLVGIVDYAHTPDALENLLAEVSKSGAAKIATVFGCGGNRDRTKRPLMGAIAYRYSDLVVVTDDNPRKEEPSSIRKDIIGGIYHLIEQNNHVSENRHREFTECEGRAKAIALACRYLAKNILNGDAPSILVLAGKGHESYQIFADHTDHFDDTQELTKALTFTIDEFCSITKRGGVIV